MTSKNPWTDNQNRNSLRKIDKEARTGYNVLSMNNDGPRCPRKLKKQVNNYNRLFYTQFLLSMATPSPQDINLW